MVAIAASGNFSILNHLTIIPALACLDDSCFPAAFCIRKETQLQRRQWLRWFIDGALAATIAYLSRPVVSNLLLSGGGQQLMNASYDPFRLVNTYGAFGSVGEARYEPIISMSVDDGRTYTEIDFPCKPGDVTRRPCFSAPYHHRIDWNVWFIGFKPHQNMLRGREQWLFTFLAKLLDDDPRARSLLASTSQDNPNIFPVPKMDSKIIKVDMYHYEMAAPLWEILSQPAHSRIWWNRTFEEVLVPPHKRTSDGQIMRLEERKGKKEKELRGGRGKGKRKPTAPVG
jgi:hypothetical protein